MASSAWPRTDPQTPCHKNPPLQEHEAPMTSATEPLHDAAEAVGSAARDEAERYAAGADRPLGGYAVLLSIYTSMLAALAALVRRRGGLPDRLAAEIGRAHV